MSAHEILDAFDVSGTDIPLPDLNEVPWMHLEYLGWIHPAGQIGYILVVSPDNGQHKGVVLRRATFNGGKPGFEMCSLCHHVHQPHGTAMFTISKSGSDRQHRIGNIVCKHLDCSLRIRNLVTPESYPCETLYVEAKICACSLPCISGFELPIGYRPARHRPRTGASTALQKPRQHHA